MESCIETSSLIIVLGSQTYEPDSVIVLYKYNSTSGKFMFKIGDFGIARRLPQGGLAGTFCGSFKYVAPEVLRGGGYNQKADMYSLGQIVLDINPYQGACLWTTIHQSLTSESPQRRMLARDVHSKAKTYLECIYAGKA